MFTIIDFSVLVFTNTIKYNNNNAINILLVLTVPEKEKQKIKKSCNRNYKNNCYYKTNLEEKNYASTAPATHLDLYNIFIYIAKIFTLLLKIYNQ